jgi:hypothetical protein
LPIAVARHDVGVGDAKVAEVAAEIGMLEIDSVPDRLVDETAIDDPAGAVLNVDT